MMFWVRRKAGVNIAGAGIAIALSALLTICVVGLLALSKISIPSFWEGPIFYVSLLIATLLTAKYYDRMPSDWVGLGLHRWVRREIGWGLVIGVGMALIAWSPSLFVGSVEFRGIERYDRLLYWILFIVVSGIGEELLFRGYLFQRGIELFGGGVTTFLFSVGFALAHIGNPEITTTGILNIFLGGIFFSACYLATGGLWLPIAAHVVWNLTLTLVLGTPASGWMFDESFFQTTSSNYVLLTGGGFGPEGGIGATVALLVGGVLLAIIPTIQIAPWNFSRNFWAFYRRQRH
ncbi:MAG: lysostaphin resistance A-like protein [Candidatus Kapaibacterium sp.]